jgi:hypothetical protein
VARHCVPSSRYRYCSRTRACSCAAVPCWFMASMFKDVARSVWSWTDRVTPAVAMASPCSADHCLLLILCEPLTCQRGKCLLIASGCICSRKDITGPHGPEGRCIDSLSPFSLSALHKQRTEVVGSKPYSSSTLLRCISDLLAESGPVMELFKPYSNGRAGMGRP